MPKQGFEVSREEQATVSSDKITIVSGVIIPGEHSIELPGFHGIGISPNHPTIVPTSYDFSKTRDFAWGASTYGYLPPGMRQDVAVRSEAQAVNVLISDAFFQSAARGDVNTDVLDLRNLAGLDDPVGAGLMHSLGAIAAEGGTSEWPLLIDTITTSLALRVMQMMGAKLKISKLHTGRMSVVIDYINSNLDKALGLDELAQVANLSLFHFARQFKNETNQTPHEYVLSARVKRSVEMARRGDAPLSIIALACGFSSQAHMTKAVKAMTGSTPGQHRRDAGIKTSSLE